MYIIICSTSSLLLIQAKMVSPATYPLSFSAFAADNLKRLTQLRREIHTHPELSFSENNTAERLIEFMNGLNNPPEIVRDIGGTGFLAIFNFEQTDGADEIDYSNVKTVVFRSELDAVPVEEKNDFAHASKNGGVSHKCGRILLLLHARTHTRMHAQQQTCKPRTYTCAHICDVRKRDVFA